MCLATVYKESDDIMGDERVVEGRILMVDLANSIVKLSCE